MSVEWGTPSGNIPSIRAWLSKNLDAEKFAFIDQFLHAAEKEHALSTIKEHALSTIIDTLQTAHDTIRQMDAECERLRAANAEQAAWIDTAVANCAKFECSKRDEQLRDLRAELAAAQKDAAMFLWLADAEPFSARWQIVRLEWWRGRDGWSDVRGEALRSAIGAAMAQENRDDQ